MIEVPSQILSKVTNHRLYSNGYYGNKLRSWDTIEQVLADKPNGNLIPRYNGKMGGSAYPFYGSPVPLSKIQALSDEWTSIGAEVSRMFWNEAAPDTHLIVQGEAMRGWQGLSLFYSNEKTTMRKALANEKRAKQVYNLTAKFIFEHCLSPNSYSDLNDLLDKFPDHVIEFSTYSINLGHNKGRNTIIWEVRKY